MHIERCGDHGPDLVLIHGWAMHAGIFAPLRDELATRYRLHLVDLPGHGHSRDDHRALQLAAIGDEIAARVPNAIRSEEHTSELQSLMRISYAVFCLKKKKQTSNNNYSKTKTKHK